MKERKGAVARSGEVEYLTDGRTIEMTTYGKRLGKQVIAILLVGALSSSTLFGCSSNSAKMSSSSLASSASNSSLEDNGASSSSSAVESDNVVEEEWLTLNQMVNINHRYYVFIQKGDLFNPVAADNTYRGLTLLVDYKSDEGDPDNIIPVVDSSAERIVLSNYSPQKDTFAFFPITRTAYFGTYPNEIFSCEEIDGIDVNSLEGGSIRDKIVNYMHSIGIETPFLKTLSSSITPVSEAPVEFSIGYYRGTKWCEETIEVDTEGFDFDSNNPIELPVEKTKDGYFYVNISSLSSGKYAVANGNKWYSQVNDYSVIEIA